MPPSIQSPELRFNQRIVWAIRQSATSNSYPPAASKGQSSKRAATSSRRFREPEIRVSESRTQRYRVRKRITGTLIQQTNDTKPDEVAPVVVFARVANRGTNVPRFGAPRHAPQHARGAAGGTLRICRRRTAVVICTKPVLAPFLNIAVHVVQTPWIRLLLTNRMRCVTRVLIPHAYSVLWIWSIVDAGNSEPPR